MTSIMVEWERQNKTTNKIRYIVELDAGKQFTYYIVIRRLDKQVERKSRKRNKTGEFQGPKRGRGEGENRKRRGGDYPLTRYEKTTG